jgi:hypothetical protein
VLTQLDVTLQPTGNVPSAPDEPQTTTIAELARISGGSDVTLMLLESVVRLTRVLELTTGGASLASKSEHENGATPRSKP